MKSKDNRIELQKKKVFKLVFANNEEEESIGESLDYSESEREKIRKEKKFKSETELIQQLRIDKENSYKA